MSNTHTHIDRDVHDTHTEERCQLAHTCTCIHVYVLIMCVQLISRIVKERISMHRRVSLYIVISETEKKTTGYTKGKRCIHETSHIANGSLYVYNSPINM